MTLEADGPRVRATLPEPLVARDLLALALETDAVVLELRAATGPFA